MDFCELHYQNRQDPACRFKAAENTPWFLFWKINETKYYELLQLEGAGRWEAFRVLVHDTNLERKLLGRYDHQEQAHDRCRRYEAGELLSWSEQLNNFFYCG